MADVFNSLVAHLDYPMFIATASNGRERAGCLVGFATQCSIDPPRFLICLSNKNRTFRVATEATALAVHLVPREAEGLAELFGGETGDEVDKFERCAWHEGPGGVPLLEECGNRFVGRILERLDCGDHVAFLLDPVEAEEAPVQGGQFEFHRAKRIDPGHEA